MTTDVASPTIAGEMASLSCCADFERILGEENDALLHEEMVPIACGYSASVLGSSEMQATGFLEREKPLSDSSIVAERSFSGIDQHSWGGEVLRVTSSVEASAIPPTTDTWAAVFQDLAMAEERGREVVGTWEAAGEALKEACEELAFEEADQCFIAGLVAQQTVRAGNSG